MPNQLTITADAGPDVANTAVVLSNVTSILFDITRKVLQVKQVDLPIKEFDLGAAAAVTTTIASGNYTLIIA